VLGISARGSNAAQRLNFAQIPHSAKKKRLVQDDSVVRIGKRDKPIFALRPTS
jgi:hypothetical protein